MSYLFYAFLGLFWAGEIAGYIDNSQVPPKQQTEIQIDLELNKTIYRGSRFGEPPQIAIWVENGEKKYFATLWVSQRMATGQWIGKIECQTCLPLWAERRRALRNEEALPGRKTPLPEGITSATPKEHLKMTAFIPGEMGVEIFLEINVSGDYNLYFPATDSKGIPDHEGNGQPSLVYRSKYSAKDRHLSQFSLIGYTVDKKGVVAIESALTPITTAKKIMNTVNIKIL